MVVTSLQLIDLDVILRTWNNVAGKIVRKKGKAINDVNSYQFISNDANISLTDYEIVGTIS
ncbi:hypothetical protein SAMN04487861_11019 [Selenomonas ruminantium]|uniref:Uncharacterized protein n=1 Tax=Selenomonas ruminantium TaxID=971 RepID=A0A1I3EG15_SELRU|nr:hypothetical protein [Selenomonas ruminantium]SFH97813.1 hypothetical protein SAMN04487861_11019 [Selenomonas ruminantium]